MFEVVSCPARSDAERFAHTVIRLVLHETL